MTYSYKMQFMWLYIPVQVVKSHFYEHYNVDKVTDLFPAAEYSWQFLVFICNKTAYMFHQHSIPSTVS